MTQDGEWPTSGEHSTVEQDTGGLGDAMHRATGGLPGNPARLDQVHARARRHRRTGIAGVAVVAATGVILAGAVPYLLNNGTGPDGPDEHAPAGVGTIESLECPEPSGGPGEPAAGGSDPFVPDGAVAARLCPVPREDLHMPALPSEITDLTLTEDVSDLVRHLNDLPMVPPPGELACHDDLGFTYDLVLAYPDRDQVVVAFEVFGCGTARSDASSYRLGGRQLHLEYERLAIAQLMAGADPALTCDGSGVHSVGDGIEEPEEGFVPAGAGLARLCLRTPEGEQEAATPTLRDFDDRLTALLNDLPEPAARECPPMGVHYTLVLGYDDGAAVYLWASPGPDGFSCFEMRHIPQGGDSTSGRWVKRIDHDDRVMALLDELATEQGVERGELELPPPGDEPDGESDESDEPGEPGEPGDDPTVPIPRGCPDPSGGPSAADPTGGGTDTTAPLVPEGATQVLICPGIAEDWGGDAEHLGETLDGSAVVAITEYLNGLEPPAAEHVCTMDLGPIYDLVFSYGDRDDVLVQVALGGCGEAQVGDEIRVGAKDLREVIEAAT